MIGRPARPLAPARFSRDCREARERSPAISPLTRYGSKSLSEKQNFEEVAKTAPTRDCGKNVTAINGLGFFVVAMKPWPGSLVSGASAEGPQAMLRTG